MVLWFVRERNIDLTAGMLGLRIKACPAWLGRSSLAATLTGRVQTFQHAPESSAAASENENRNRRGTGRRGTNVIYEVETFG